MLTGDLIRARVKGSDVEASFVKVDKLVDDAQDLVDTFAAACEERWTRGELDEAIAELVGDRRDHKILKGLAKVCQDRSQFEVASPMPPSELRLKVFRLAQERGPLAVSHGKLGRVTASDVLAEVAEELGLTAEQVQDALYADLPSEQRIVSFEVPSGEWLVHRYNVALAQALLLKATRVRIHLVKPSPARLRQLFRHVKFYQLIHYTQRDGDTVRITLDGPTSLFQQSTRYGMQLATFLPALLLQEGPWALDATVLWTRARHQKHLSLSSEDGLVSHYRDQGAYKTRIHEWFEERFAAADTGWTLDENTVPIDLGGRALVLPDYRLRKDGRTAYLEILGYWRKQYLERRVELLSDYAPGNLILAVSRKLRGDKDKLDLPGQVIEFAEVLPTKQVIEAAEAVARKR